MNHHTHRSVVLLPTFGASSGVSIAGPHSGMPDGRGTRTFSSSSWFVGARVNFFFRSFVVSAFVSASSEGDGLEPPEDKRYSSVNSPLHPCSLEDGYRKTAHIVFLPDINLFPIFPHFHLFFCTHCRHFGIMQIVLGPREPFERER